MRLIRLVRRRYGDRRWDLFLRGTGVIGLVGIPVALYLPRAIPLVWLAVLGLPANGPLSPILPTLFDPMLIEVGKIVHPVAVTAVALAVYMYMEVVNWHIYHWVLRWDRLTKLRDHRAVQRGVAWYGRQPFLTTVVFAVTPMPFWVARCLALLRNYSVYRFMVATAIGRIPRFYLYAWLGTAVAIPTWVIVGVIVGGAVIAIGSRLLRGEPLLADAVLDTAQTNGGVGSPEPTPPPTNQPPLR